MYNVNEYFEAMEHHMKTAEEFGEQMLNSMAHAKDQLHDFINAAEKTIASGDQEAMKLIAEGSELGGDTPEEALRLLIESAKVTIADFERRMSMLSQILYD